MKTNSMTCQTFAVLAVVTCFVGCGEKVATVENYDASAFLLTTAPDGAVEVSAARNSSKDADDVVVVGRIGGSLDPWVKGVAAFSIVDSSLRACSDETEEGEVCSCKTPWDYCCETDKLPTAMALVKFVDDGGKVVPHDAKTNFGVQELDTVIIKGKAKRDDAGNLTILAKSMFVKK
jgi:hypothetical protein